MWYKRATAAGKLRRRWQSITDECGSNGLSIILACNVTDCACDKRWHNFVKLRTKFAQSFGEKNDISSTESCFVGGTSVRAILVEKRKVDAK